MTRRASEGGFALVEAATALLVLGVVALSTVAAMRSGLAAAREAAEERTALEALRGEVESHRALGVRGLLAAQPDGAVVQLASPTGLSGAALTVRRLSEAEAAERLGCEPLDLDEDGEVGEVEVEAHARLIVLLFTISWDGPTGPRELDVVTGVSDDLGG